ncbi:hypothetical protein [Methylobacter sp.]
MNIQRLIKAAQKIDALAQKQEEHTQKWMQLTKDVRAGRLTNEDAKRRCKELDNEVRVFDFGTPINELRAALKAMASKKQG